MFSARDSRRGRRHPQLRAAALKIDIDVNHVNREGPTAPAAGGGPGGGRLAWQARAKSDAHQQISVTYQPVVASAPCPQWCTRGSFSPAWQRRCSWFHRASMCSGRRRALLLALVCAPSSCKRVACPSASLGAATKTRSTRQVRSACVNKPSSCILISMSSNICS